MTHRIRLLAGLACTLMVVACGGSNTGANVPNPLLTTFGVTSTTMAFPSQAAGTSSPVQTTTVANNSGSTVTLSSIVLGGTNASLFSEASDCPASLANGSTCSIWVVFSPTTAASATASVTITSSASGSPLSITLNGTGVAGSYATNQTPVLVDGGPVALRAAGKLAVNQAYVSVTLCTPGSTTACQVIDHVLIDTASSGLRILNSALLASGGPSPIASTDAGSGNALYACVGLSAGYGWGSVSTADVHLGGYTLGSLPVHVIGNAGGITAPSACTATQSTAVTTAAQLGANGILGVSTLVNDCPSCASAPQPTPYFACGAAGCTPVAVPVSQQVINPVTLLTADNNGVTLVMNAPVAGGQPTLTGSLYFGVATETNNQLGNTTVLLTEDATGAVAANVGGTAYTSYFSAGSNANYFYSPSITACTDLPRYYCPSATSVQSATLQGGNGNTQTVSFSVGNADVIAKSATYAAQVQLAGPQGSGAPFIWGLPFFYGRTVYLLFSGAVAGGVSGPAIGF